MLFAINSKTGAITLNGAIDYESATSHQFTVIATSRDHSGAAKNTEKTFEVNVININDNDPALTPQAIDVLDSTIANKELLDINDSKTSKDIDLDGDVIKYAIKKGNENKLFVISETTGKLSLATDKKLNFDKSDQHVLNITATDSGGRKGSTDITINVQDSNTAPVAVDDAITLNEDSRINISATSGVIERNDRDADGDPVKIHKFYLGESTETDPTEGLLGQAINGTYGLLTLNTDGSYQYSADNADALGSGETAIDAFHYILTDNKLTQTADIKFTIQGINDMPYIVDATKKKKYTEGQSNVTVIDGSLDIVDPDNTELASAKIQFSSDTYQSSEDVLGFTNAYSISGNWDNTTGKLSLTGTASLSDYIAALETVTYTNTNNTNPVIGHRKIEWSVNDGETNSTTITSIVDVGGTNDAPESRDEAVAVEAGSMVSTESQAKLLANDTDPEGDSLTIQQFRLGTEQQSSTEFQSGTTLVGQFGKMTMESDGSYTYIADQTASRRLLTGETRTETFTYTISDSKDTDTGEITFNITGINDSPVAINDALQVEEDSSKFRPNVQGLLANDTDIDGDTLSITTVRVGAEKLDPFSPSQSRTATDTYGTIAINEDGSFRYTADQDKADALDEGDLVSEIFTYTLSDGESTDQGEIQIDIIGMNDAPVLSEVQSGVITAQDDSSKLAVSGLSGQLVASDPDESASLTFGITRTKLSSNIIQTSSTHNSLYSSHEGSYGHLSINQISGEYTYRADSKAIYNLSSGQKAIDSFDIFVSDGSLKSTQEFIINITGGNYSGDKLPKSGNSSSGTDSSETGSKSSSEKTASGSLGDSGFGETRFISSDFAKDAVASLLTDPITGTQISSDFETQQQSILVASSDLSGLQLAQTKDLGDVTQQKSSAHKLPKGLLIPSISSALDSNKFLELIEYNSEDILNIVNSSNGIRLKFPKSYLQVLSRAGDNVNPQKKNLTNTNEATWINLVPANRTGMVPLLVSLNTKPSRETTVRLNANTSDSSGTADLIFSPKNWEKNQLVWIDTNQLKCQETMELKLITLPFNLSNKITVDRLEIAIQKPMQCANLGHIEEAQIKKESEEDNSSLDLALSSITEKQSALYLLARASLSPFLALTNMALHIIKQLEQDNSKETAQKNQDISKISETGQQQKAKVMIKNIQFFDPINLNAIPETGTPNSFNNEIVIFSGDHVPAVTDIANSF